MFTPKPGDFGELGINNKEKWLSIIIFQILYFIINSPSYFTNLFFRNPMFQWVENVFVLLFSIKVVYFSYIYKNVY
ncbi:hypothetical protein C1634_024820 [Chryseobacterium viscerum]|uniref:Uncharacterized protein n=1 Tax=Chryseobacterium viscerum TaxID=1037377 RepID=A0A316W9P9_9FLAO|nr:hypothetical protein C1634_024820 [Chryseobacterium viscerum]